MDTKIKLPESDDIFVERSTTSFNKLFLLFLLFLLLLIFKVVYLIFSEDYGIKNDSLSIRWEDVVPIRGTIYSDNGQTLAVDILRYSLTFDPDATGLIQKKDSMFFMHNVDTLSIAFSQVFEDKSPKEYYDFLVGKFLGRVKGNFSIGNRRITAGELGKLKSMSPLMRIDRNKSGIIVKTHYRREYPNGNIAKRTIGLKNDSAAFTGLEKSLDYVLAGKKGTQKVVRVTKDIWRPQYDVNNVEVQNGWDVITTIDLKLQDFTQEVLGKQVEEMKAEWGTAIVLDVKTGDVKAVANATFDHKHNKVVVEQYDGEFYAIHRRVEPGSTFKTVALMCMLDDQNIPMSEKYNTGMGQPKRLAKDAIITDDHAVGVVDVQQILEQSSNIGMAMIANKYYRSNPSRLIDRVEKTGIYETLDLAIPTTIKPTHYRPGKKYWSYGGFLKMSFGYTVDMTPMHIATFYNGLANGGVMLNPRFVTSFRDSRNHEMLDTVPVKVLNPKMCSDETLRKIRQCLEGVVIRGTGRKTVGNAKFKCAGKTGTAKLSYGGGGYDGRKIKYYASFVGYFPADAPRYTVLVGIETHLNYPRERPYSGAYVSGPVFRAIADYVYDHEKMAPAAMSTLSSSGRSSNVYVTIGDAEKNLSTARDLGVRLNVAPSTTKMFGQDSLGIITRDSSNTIMNLQGFALSDALQLLYGNGYSVSVVGEGSVQKVEINDKKAVLYLK